MNRSLQRILLPGIFLGSLFWLTSCYTQIGTTREEYRNEEYTSTQNDTTGDNYEEAYANSSPDDDSWAPRYRVGFDYYYPTIGFGFSTYDPWYWRNSGWYYYDPFWCGTYYPAIYAGWYPYWYPPAYSFNPGYGHHGYANGRTRGTTRTIGSTRGGGDVRGGGRDAGSYRGGSSGVPDLPTGYRSGSGTRGTPAASAPRVSTGRRNDGGAREGTRGNAGVRGGTARGGSKESPRSESPRTYTPPPRDRGADRGAAGRSYSPPPSLPPAQSPPPSDGGRPSGSSGGTRGGRGR